LSILFVFLHAPPMSFFFGGKLLIFAIVLLVSLLSLPSWVEPGKLNPLQWDVSEPAFIWALITFSYFFLMNFFSPHGLVQYHSGSLAPLFFFNNLCSPFPVGIWSSSPFLFRISYFFVYVDFFQMPLPRGCPFGLYFYFF